MKFKELTEKEMQHVVGGHGRFATIGAFDKTFKKLAKFFSKH